MFVIVLINNEWVHKSRLVFEQLIRRYRYQRGSTYTAFHCFTTSSCVYFPLSTAKVVISGYDQRDFKNMI